MTEAVVLGDLALDRVTEFWIEERRKLARHPIAGWDGDLVQDLGAEAAFIRLRGVAYGEDAGGRLESLRTVAAAGQPLDFTASAAVASLVEQVLIARLWVHQVGGQRDTYHYEIDLVQHVQPPPPEVAGFDVGFLDGVGDLADLAAAADVAAFAESLGDSLAETMAAIEQAAAFVEDVVDLVEGAAGLKKLVDALGGVVGATAS